MNTEETCGQSSAVEESRGCLRAAAAHCRYGLGLLIAFACLQPQPAFAAELIDGLGGESGFGVDIAEFAAPEDGGSFEARLGGTSARSIRVGGRQAYSVWLNENGTLSFDGPLLGPPPADGVPLGSALERITMVAPFWADIDTQSRDGLEHDAENRVYVAADEDGLRLFVTWYRVRIAGADPDSRLSFQAILSQRNTWRETLSEITFRYERCDVPAIESIPSFRVLPTDAFEMETTAFVPASGDVFDPCVENGGIVTAVIGRGPSRPICGDGFSQGDEACDDGNQQSGDGCSSRCEVEVEVDSDEDGLLDTFDNCRDEPNADQADLDGDRIGDVCDVCPGIRDPIQADWDSDGIGNECDPCLRDPINDADGDGLCATNDLCPLVSDPEQRDADNDGIGDACDLCPDDPENDRDRDDVCSREDNCPGIFNPDQIDADADGLGDECDVDADGDEVYASLDCDDANPRLGAGVVLYFDVDFDGRGDSDVTRLWCPLRTNAAGEPDTRYGVPPGWVIEGRDNCPELSNVGWFDADGDFIGDACDLDIDGDGIFDVLDLGPRVRELPCANGQTEQCVDNCPLTRNPLQEDPDDDGIGDVCDRCPTVPGVPALGGCPWASFDDVPEPEPSPSPVPGVSDGSESRDGGCTASGAGAPAAWWLLCLVLPSLASVRRQRRGLGAL